MVAKAKQRDKYITRQIHKLFWQANFQHIPSLVITYAARFPSFAITNTVLPYLAALGVQAILDHKMSDVYMYAWLIVGASVVALTLQAIASIAVTKNAVTGAEYLQNKVFVNFLQKDYEFYATTFTGALGAQAIRLRDMYNVYGELVTFKIPKQVAILVTGLVIIGISSIPLAVVTFMSICMVIGFTLLSGGWRLPYRRKAYEAGSIVAGQVGDAISHGSTVKSFASEDYELQRLQAPLRDWSKKQRMSWLLFIPADSIRWLLSAIATGLLLIMSAQLYMQGAIPITIVVLVQLFVIRMIASTMEISEYIKTYEEIIGGAYEPVKTMLMKPSITDPLRPKSIAKNAELTLKLENVSFRYDSTGNAADTLKKLSLTISQGEKIGIVGYSGSGKTTLTKLLLRFMDVTEGKVTISDTDIRDLAQKELRRTISYVPQEPLLFHRSIAENISYGLPNATKSQIQHAARLAYVDEFVKELPKGYATLVGERGVKLSGGQRQRVAIARALLKDSPILVLDEATSALDSRSEKYIQNALWELMKGRTAIVIAHRLSTIQHLDRIIVLDKGRIAQVGTHDELKEKPGIYADLWKHQSGGYIGVPAQQETA